MSYNPRLPRTVTKSQLAGLFGYAYTFGTFRRKVMTDELLVSLGIEPSAYSRQKVLPPEWTQKIFEHFKIEPSELED